MAAFRARRNIYDLVVRRFLAVLMPPCAYEEVELTLRAGDHDFTAKGPHRLGAGLAQGL